MVPIAGSLPLTRTLSPREDHEAAYLERMTRLCGVLNVGGPIGCPYGTDERVPAPYCKYSGVEPIGFDAARNLWRERMPHRIHDVDPFILHPTESKMKLLGVSLEEPIKKKERYVQTETSKKDFMMTIPDQLKAMINDPNLTVWNLADLDENGMPITFMYLMLACQEVPGRICLNDYYLSWQVWKSGLAFMWAVLKQRYNPDGLDEPTA